jgi:DNA-binding CsgD family transcriptional regulator
MIGQGKATRSIAEELHVSVKTVDAHRANIKEKLGLRTGNELVRYAVRWVEAQNRN